MGDRSIKTMKNKKSSKNLKQFRKFRTRAKFYIFVLFREWLMEGVNKKAQNWFFPIFGLILLAGILHHEATKEYVFENPKLTAVDAIRSMSESGHTGSNMTEDYVLEDATVVPRKQTLGSSTSTHSTPVRASGVIEAKIHEVFSEEGRLAVAVAKAESSLNPEAKGWNCYYWYNSKRYSGACKPEDREKAWSVDCGIFQINVKGQECPKELYDIEYNTKVAKNMSKSERGWKHWWTYNTGKHLKYLAIN